MPDQSEQSSFEGKIYPEYSFRSGTLKALSVAYEILLDFILVGILLLTLSLIHIFTHNIPLSEGFKNIFTIIHEFIVIANYLLLAYKSIFRLWNHLE